MLCGKVLPQLGHEDEFSVTDMTQKSRFWTMGVKEMLEVLQSLILWGSLSVVWNFQAH